MCSDVFEENTQREGNLNICDTNIICIYVIGRKFK